MQWSRDDAGQDWFREIDFRNRRKKSFMRSHTMRGFSLLELTGVVGISVIVCAIAINAMMPILRTAHVDNGYNITLGAIRQTRDFAVGQRQQYSVTFNNGVSPNTITITQAGNGNVVATYQLPIDVNFVAVAGLPAAPNTPDGFGAGATAIDFDQGIAGGIQNVIYFMPDGSAQDVAGNLNNGVVYVALGNGIDATTGLKSSHAITVWGATGRIRGWKIDYTGGAPYWRQN
jgi:Tfp pilus assembly protein FimT